MSTITEHDKLKNVCNEFTKLSKEISSVVVGQEHVIERLIIALLCKGHIIIEGVPGLAKTLMIKTVAQASGLSYSRIQFTPDMMPSDITGTKIYDMRTSTFVVRKGPVFSNIVLADEINRAPPKTQSALLECMQEKQVTIDVESFKVPTPFFVFATQNPIEHEGTYPLRARLEALCLR